MKQNLIPYLIGMTTFGIPFMPAVIELLAETIAGRDIIISKSILGAIVGIQSSFMPGLGVSSKTKKE